jgi:hypothetical protein
MAGLMKTAADVLPSGVQTFVLVHTKRRPNSEGRILKTGKRISIALQWIPYSGS